MSHTRVKTTYNVEGPHGSTEVVQIFCHHNHSTDFTTFYWEDGEVVNLIVQEWDGPTLLDAIDLLTRPFKDGWGGELKEGVEYWNKLDKESNFGVLKLIKYKI